MNGGHVDEEQRPCNVRDPLVMLDLRGATDRALHRRDAADVGKAKVVLSDRQADLQSREYKHRTSARTNGWL